MKKLITLTILIMALLFAMSFSFTALAAEGPAEPTEAPAVTDPAADSGLLGETAVTDVVNNVVSALIKLVFAVISLVLTRYIIPFAKNTVGPFIRDTIIPWFEEHRLRSIVEGLVHGAEQLANSGQIPKDTKKAYVLKMLADMGIEVTPEIDAIIEGAVLDLDKKVTEILDAVLDIINERNESAHAGSTETEAAAGPAEVPTDGQA